ncbi:hypothetical protein BN2476_350278 [Paraburkholderia piptadeniae]|uniref:Uncharacterized protein n=1 Tax=Paraburkholderia piptadeniae TaxID=1701573 RepID=A0A1N7S8T9_9BURK|nr:hypothetical protein [Paraburkholderia piptadeniae]SIT43762.1 hypothetical protein BN2476_350278 [Paraburkholderia piptadeniae]
MIRNRDLFERLVRQVLSADHHDEALEMEADCYAESGTQLAWEVFQAVLKLPTETVDNPGETPRAAVPLPRLDDELATLRHEIEGGVKRDSMQALRLCEQVEVIGERFKRELADGAAAAPCVDAQDALRERIKYLEKRLDDYQSARASDAAAGEQKPVATVAISKPGDALFAASFMHLTDHGRATLGRGKHDLYTRSEPRALTDAARDVLAERQRQVSAEGWTPEHDDEHDSEEMAIAAACYAESAGGFHHPAAGVPSTWPWTNGWWKPTTPRRDLVKAGALILAEIERLDRALLRESEAQ